MKMKSITLLVIAGACGLVAMLGVQQMLSGSKNAEAGEETVPMLVATVEIAAGIPLDATNVAFKRTPRSAAPEGIVTSEAEYKDRALKFPAVPGEPIMLAKLGPPGVIGPSIEIPKGMRVVTVPCNAQLTHSGMLRPGDRVDILLTYKTDSGETKTVTVLEFIKVFATDSIRDSQSATTQDMLAKNVSFLVDPKQAALLMLAESKGALSLSLRSKVDDAPVDVGTIGESQLDRSNANKMGLGDDAAKQLLLEEPAADVRRFLTEHSPARAALEKVSAEPATPMWQIEIFAGGERRVQDVALPAVSPRKDGGVGGWLQRWLQGS